MPTVLIQEQTEYDNFIGKKAPELKQQIDFNQLFECNITEENLSETDPSAGSEDCYKSIYVHFTSQEDVDDFAALINQHITKTIKELWYPDTQKDILNKFFI